MRLGTSPKGGRKFVSRTLVLVFCLSVSVQALAKADKIATPVLTQARGSSTAIVLQWTNMDGESGYRIDRAIDPEKGFVGVGQTNADVLTWQDTDAAQGSVYYYRVVARSTGGDSLPSNYVGAVRLSAPVPAASDLEVSFKSNEVILKWASVIGAEAYAVSIGSSPGASDIKNAELVTTPQCGPLSLSAGTYYWRVQAVNKTNLGESDASKEHRFAVGANAPRIRLKPSSLTITGP